MSPVPLDAQVYPHLWDRVRSHAPPELLLRLRLVDRASSAEATRALFDHVVITRASGLELRSGHGCRLPVPSLDGDKYHPKLPPGQWGLTRVLDLATLMRGLDEQSLPGLKYVRRRVWCEVAPPAPTVVDTLCLPTPQGEEAYMDSVSEGTKRHVTVVLYDPAAKAIESDNVMNVDFSEEHVHGVFVFRACPAGESRVWARGMWEGEEVGYREAEADEGGEGNGETTHEEDGSDIDAMSELSDLSDTPAADKAHRTFLNNFLWCAAQRIHEDYTFVGLESVPTHILAKELKRDLAEVAARAAEPGWHTYLTDAVLEGIRAIPRDPGWEEEEPHERDVAEVVEVLTMDAFRAQVGEEAWMMETYADLV